MFCYPLELQLIPVEMYIYHHRDQLTTDIICIKLKLKLTLTTSVVL